VTIPIIAIGVAASFTGIIVGNVAANQIWDEMDEKAKSEGGMFSALRESDPGGFGGPRARAIDEYKASNPDGKRLHKLRSGQILTIAGVLVMVVGFFI
jgi:hypothetical protein